MFASRLAVLALAALLVMDHAVAQSHATPDDPIVYEVRHEMVGGISNTPADCSLVDASVRGALVGALNARLGDARPYRFERTIEVRTQVVAGTMLHVTYEASRPGAGPRGADAEGAGAPRTEIRRAKIWQRLDGENEVTADALVLAVEAAPRGAVDDASSPRLLGGFRPLDPATAEALAAAAEYARAWTTRNPNRDDGGDASVLRPVQIHPSGSAEEAEATAAEARAKTFYLCEASVQVVNGFNYRLKMARGEKDAECDVTGTVYKSLDDEYEVAD